MGHLEYCSNCGTQNDLSLLDGRDRKICPNCGTVHYENPTPASTVIVVVDGSLLLVKRAVEPAIGEWCLPGGFMEIGETPQQSAKRELLEETGIVALSMAFLDFCPFPGGLTGSVMLMGFVGTELSGTLLAGDDALEADYFPLNDLPDIAFPCHRWLLEQYLSARR